MRQSSALLSIPAEVSPAPPWTSPTLRAFRRYALLERSTEALAVDLINALLRTTTRLTLILTLTLTPCAGR